MDRTRFPGAEKGGLPRRALRAPENKRNPSAIVGSGMKGPFRVGPEILKSALKKGLFRERVKTGPSKRVGVYRHFISRFALRARARPSPFSSRFFRRRGPGKTAFLGSSKPLEPARVERTSGPAPVLPGGARGGSESAPGRKRCLIQHLRFHAFP